MSFFTPTFGRKRFIAASVIGLAWLGVAYLLWAYPDSMSRRSGVAREHYGWFDAWIRKSSYYRLNSGQHLGYEVGEGLAITIVITVFVTLFAIGVYLCLSRRWHHPGHCVKCDYNLRGNTSGTCPECGTHHENCQSLAPAPKGGGCVYENNK